MKNRYVEYFEAILLEKAIPDPRTRRLVSISMSPIPRFNLVGDKGVALHFDIFRLTQKKKLVYSTLQEGEAKQFSATKQNSLSVPVNIPLRDDILIEFRHGVSVSSTEPMFHLVINIGMIAPMIATESGCLPIPLSWPLKLDIPKNELEKGQKDGRIPVDFVLGLIFEEISPHEEAKFALSGKKKLERLSLWKKRCSSPTNNEESSDIFMDPLRGALCYFGDFERKIAQARDIACPTRGNICMKGGWLVKRGHKIKNWKRRWFALKGHIIQYYQNPRVLSLPSSSLSTLSKLLSHSTAKKSIQNTKE